MLERGERAPDFVLPDDRGVQTQFYAEAGGRPLVLVFGCVLDGLSAEAIAVVPEGTETPDGTRLFVDPKAVVATVYGVDGCAAFVLDANLRVVRAVDPEGDDVRGEIEVALGGLQLDRGAPQVRSQAPVLFVPRVLDAEQCGFLMSIWSQQHQATGVEASVAGGREDVVSDVHKRRQDHVVEDPKLIRILTSSIGRRVIPEIERSFLSTGSLFEGFKIACYESESSGFFEAHRDNLSPSTAHRKFALSLNLNDDYDGGELVFPEFGSHAYRPGQGEALIFSCATLHAVRPVTQGRRFTLLTFLYDRERGARPEEAVDPFRSAVQDPRST